MQSKINALKNTLLLRIQTITLNSRLQRNKHMPLSGNVINHQLKEKKIIVKLLFAFHFKNCNSLQL